MTHYYSVLENLYGIEDTLDVCPAEAATWPEDDFYGDDSENSEDCYPKDANPPEPDSLVCVRSS